ncbi:cyclin-D4-1-like isoform X1 [Senna tora]|uniref:B-like cyclin n=1 Tax=Senna tora TaxID=362788 RepID=A0A834SX87_9FABA|nr:cyclin-D4-1-like isoform X1 [Senna tora]
MSKPTHTISLILSLPLTPMSHSHSSSSSAAATTHLPSSDRHHSPPSDDTAIIGEFIDRETHHMPSPDYLQRLRDRSIDVSARENSINWILMVGRKGGVHGHYRFRPLTALLSVNYMDRFLSCSSLPRPSAWAFHLLSVACLSLAAKMEEPRVPLLLDLQLFEPGFIFEPITVQRMELHVLSTLKWRLRSVTPFDYLHYFISKLTNHPPSSSESDPKPESMTRLLSRASRLLLTTTRVIELMRFPPSTVAAAAAVACSAGRGRDINQSLSCFHDRVDKEMVRSCHQLMEEYVADTCPKPGHSKRRRAEVAPPSSPVGVLDAATYGSCDTRSENPGSRSQAEEPEPSEKRGRSSVPDVQRQ